MSPYNLIRFSERLAWSTPQNAFSLLLDQKRKAGIPLLDLTVSNPTAVLAAYPHQEIAQAYAAIPSFHYEPAALGSLQAREAIAHWYAGEGIAASPERIALTASTSEAYSLLFKLLCDPGDEILIPRPSYPLFDYLAGLESVKTVQYHVNYDGVWFIDFESLQKSLSARSKAIVIVNPNNPTGSFLNASELQRLSELARSHGLAIISDEVFMTYPAQAANSSSIVRTLVGHDDVLSFSMNGLSKAAGMPQMKLGWIAVNGPAQEAAGTIKKLELLLDSYLSVATPVQSALPELLKIGRKIHSQIDAHLQQNRQTLNLPADSPVKPLASDGGWSAILQMPAICSEEDWIGNLVVYETTVVQPGYFYDLAKEAFVVVSLLTEPGDFAEGIRRLHRLVAKTIPAC